MGTLDIKRLEDEVSASGLVGVWRLLSYFDLDETGDTRTGPLGPAPQGLLIYSAQGYMSVSMMRSGQDALPPEGSAGADAHTSLTRPLTSYMGYSGKWRLSGGRVIHEVMVSAHRHIVDTELVREWSIDEDRLTIYGTAHIGERPQQRVLHWQRA